MKSSGKSRSLSSIFCPVCPPGAACMSSIAYTPCFPHQRTQSSMHRRYPGSLRCRALNGSLTELKPFWAARRISASVM